MNRTNDLKVTRVAAQPTSSLSLKHSKNLVPKHEVKRRNPPATTIPAATLTHLKAKIQPPVVMAVLSDSIASMTSLGFLLEDLEGKLDDAGMRLAQECLDEALAEKRTLLTPKKRGEFVNAIVRSIESVTKRTLPIPATMSSLAFKLAFNLDCGSLLSPAGANEPDEPVKLTPWETIVVAKLGPEALSSMVSSRGMPDVMLINPEKGATVVDDSLYVARKLLKKVLPAQCKGSSQAARYVNMAMALRNFSVRQIEVFGPMGSKLEAALAKKAKELLKGKGQADAIAWTIALLQVANEFRAKNYSPK